VTAEAVLTVREAVGFVVAVAALGYLLCAVMHRERF
jgi:hypothetical protein